MVQELSATILYKKTLGCLLGGLIGDAMGTPAEGKDYRDIDKQLGWIDDFNSDGTDDTVMKNLLAEALIRTKGYATLDDWAKVWLEVYEETFGRKGKKVGKFFMSVLHTANKINRHSTPRMAALGNMPSSSSAMCISPVGIVNACNPRQAAQQAYIVASLIHIHDVAYCQDGAAAMAAAVAEAFSPAASVDSIIAAASNYILEVSGKEILDRIEKTVAFAKAKKGFKDFRAAVYEDAAYYLKRITCDSRETVPLTLALFYLADGDPEKCVIYGSNFGRDADTIASMCGAIGGAFRGVDGFRKQWSAKAYQNTDVDQSALAEKLAAAAVEKFKAEHELSLMFESVNRLEGAK